jgi:hypothetical protein
MNGRLRSSVVFLLGLVGCAVGAAAAGASPKPASSATTIRGNVDVVRRVQGGKVLEVIGWAADLKTGSVQKVDIRLNDKPVGVAQLGMVRADVAQTFRRSDLSKSGWTAKVDLSRLKPGSYRVSAYAWSGGVSAPLAMGKVEFRLP